MLAIVIASCNMHERREMKVVPLIDEITVVPGSRSMLVLQIEIPARSHIYGNPKGPGTGKATEVIIKPVKDIDFGTPRYRAPKKFFFTGEKEYTWGYEDQTRIFIPFTVSEQAAPGIHPIQMKFDSLLCSDNPGGSGASYCIPKIFNVTATLRIAAKGKYSTAYSRTVIDEFNTSTAPVGDAAVDKLKDHKAFESTDQLPDNLQFSPRYIDHGVTGIIQAILFGLLAGFLLNFMPCVLPVVSLKIMGFVQNAGKSRRELFQLGLMFSFGILTSFAVLAALAAFFGYRWGGLFQHRLFLVVMTGIVFALALSMFGVFAINIPAFAGRAINKQRSLYLDAFMKGLLATLLATPCSGPFLGGTLAWALSQTPVLIFIVFMSIGIGMALPYVILTINPVLLKYIPKPGTWLMIFEKIMGFLLIFTAVYLIGILDDASRMPMVALLGFIALGLWVYGTFGSITETGTKRVISFFLMIGIVISGFFLSFHYLFGEKRDLVMEQKPFRPGRLIKNRDSGIISVINFTADWCPNCKLVDNVTLHSSEVTGALNTADIDYMVADITEKNSEAERLMKLFKSQAIPLLAIVPAGNDFSRPIILRDIYSASDVLKALKTARQGTNADGFKYQLEINPIK